MGFGRSAALTARGTGTYPARALRLENLGDATAVEVTVTFTGANGPAELLEVPVPALPPGASVELPLRRFRRDAVFRLAVRWVADNGAAGEFFGVVTAGP